MGEEDEVEVEGGQLPGPPTLNGRIERNTKGYTWTATVFGARDSDEFEASMRHLISRIDRIITERQSLGG